jgi:hypothetical protein
MSWPMHVFSNTARGGARIAARTAVVFSSRFCRAGFEPRRRRPTSPRFESTKTDDTLGDTKCTHGSNPARLRQGW